MFKIIQIEDLKKPMRHVDRLFIHCSASDTIGSAYEGIELVKTIDSWHRARRFNGVGYHYVIDKKGNLMTARSIERTPAAQRGHNRGTLTVCVHGLDIHNFTSIQLDTLYDFCLKHDNLYDDLTFHGHREVSAKTCPVLDYINLLSLDRFGFMA